MSQQNNNKTTTTEMKIDYSLIPENVPSLCVPYVFENINEDRLRRIFTELDIGEVTKIDLVPYTAHDGKRVNRVFVHLKWNTQESTNKVRTKLLCGRDVKMVYEDPWHWRVSASRGEKTREKKKIEHVKSRPRIEDYDGNVMAGCGSVCGDDSVSSGNKCRPQRPPRAIDIDQHRPTPQDKTRNKYQSHEHIPPRERKPTLSLEVETSSHEHIPPRERNKPTLSLEVPTEITEIVSVSSPARSEASFVSISTMTTSASTSISEQPMQQRRRNLTTDVDAPAPEQKTQHDFENYPTVFELPKRKKKIVKKSVSETVVPIMPQSSIEDDEDDDA